MSKPTYVNNYKEIESVINLYLNGVANAKSEILKPAFSEQATMLNLDEKGALSLTPIQGLFDMLDAHFVPSNPTCAIAYININGDATSDRVDSDNVCGFGFTDYFNLLKVEGKWKIVNKIFHTNYAPAN